MAEFPTAHSPGAGLTPHRANAIRRGRQHLDSISAPDLGALLSQYSPHHLTGQSMSHEDHASRRIVIKAGHTMPTMSGRTHPQNDLLGFT